MNKYNAKEDLAYVSCHMAAFLFMLGFREEDFQSIVIDDAISKIRERYAYRPEITNLGPHPATIAVSEFLKYLNIMYSRNVRRAWFDVQVAMHEVDNGK